MQWNNATRGTMVLGIKELPGGFGLVYGEIIERREGNGSQEVKISVVFPPNCPDMVFPVSELIAKSAGKVAILAAFDAEVAARQVIQDARIQNIKDLIDEHIS